jgi:toxin ParE1/3/4
MKARFVLAPQAADDLADIWRYITDRSSVAIADHVESVIRDKFAFLTESPGAGHHRRNLISEKVKFFPVYSYLIVYRPATDPLQIVAVLHGRRDVEQVLRGRL